MGEVLPLIDRSMLTTSPGGKRLNSFPESKEKKTRVLPSPHPAGKRKEEKERMKEHNPTKKERYCAIIENSRKGKGEKETSPDARRLILTTGGKGRFPVEHSEQVGKRKQRRLADGKRKEGKRKGKSCSRRLSFLEKKEASSARERKRKKPGLWQPRRKKGGGVPNAWQGLGHLGKKETIFPGRRRKKQGRRSTCGDEE